MTHIPAAAVLTVPPVLDTAAIDALAEQLGGIPEAAPVRVDARPLRSADPFGLLGLLVLGHRLGQRGARPPLHLPEGAEGRSVLARMRFAPAASGGFELHGGVHVPARGSVPLLEITRIESHSDIHRVIEHLAESAGEVLVKGLGYRAIDTISFSILLSEICQNVIEHAEAPGWVAIQAYKHHRASGGPAVQIAVADAGMGVRNSLARDHAARYGERWDDATALEAAFVQGVTRFRDPGRGQGLRDLHPERDGTHRGCTHCAGDA